MLRVDQTILGHDVRQEAEGSLHLRRRAVSTAENDDIRSQLFQELPRRRISPEKSWGTLGKVGRNVSRCRGELRCIAKTSNARRYGSFAQGV